MVMWCYCVYKSRIDAAARGLELSFSGYFEYFFFLPLDFEVVRGGERILAGALAVLFRSSSCFGGGFWEVG
jgi:hypothetical protein